MSPAQGIRISVSLSALQFCFVSCWIATVCFCSRIRLYSFEPEAVLYVFSRLYLAHVVYCHWEEPGSFLTALQQWMFTSWDKPGMWFSKIYTSCSFLVLCAGVDWKHSLSLSYQTWRIKSVTYYECIVLGRKKKKKRIYLFFPNAAYKEWCAKMYSGTRCLPRSHYARRTDLLFA